MLGCSSGKHQVFKKNRNHVYSQVSLPQSEYLIKAHDRLSIIFYQYPELSSKTKDSNEHDLGIEVNTNGTILLPLVGRVEVVGMSKDLLEDKLYKMYGEYLEKSPALKVEVLNQKIYVLGEVKSPGALAYNRQSFITPIKAIAQRGGLNDSAKREKVLIVRGDKNNYHIATLNLTDMNSISQANMVLMPEDIIYVAHNSMKDVNLPLNGLNASLSLINTLFNTITLYQVLK